MRQAINRSISLNNKILILFGGFLNQFGWFFFSFGLIFFWIFALNADVSFIHFQGDVVEVRGVVTDVIETDAQINKRSIYEYHYQFKNKEGRVFDSFSYQKSSRVKVNHTLLIEYPKNRIDLSRIKGM
ncbi:hypothetical protein MJH12_05725, partial [bacterium]|nr:hypothetical protein [bacterium]